MADYIAKRRSPRRRFERIVGFLRHGRYHVTEAIEIGEGGIMVIAPEPAATDDRVVLTFSVDGHELVSTRAEVRYEIELAESGKKAYGLQFQNLDLSYKRYIRRYVSLKTLKEARAEQQKAKQKKTETIVFSVDEEGKAKPTVA